MPEDSVCKFKSFPGQALEAADPSESAPLTWAQSCQKSTDTKETCESSVGNKVTASSGLEQIRENTCGFMFGRSRQAELGTGLQVCKVVQA